MTIQPHRKARAIVRPEGREAAMEEATARREDRYNNGSMQLHTPVSTYRNAMFRKISLLGLFVLAACAPKTIPFEPVTSGLEVEVFIGPMCPVVQQGQECPDQPYQATLTVLHADGEEYQQFETDQNGRYTITLLPGQYILRPERTKDNPIASAGEQKFTIMTDEITHLVVNYDSGIR